MGITFAMLAGKVMTERVSEQLPAARPGMRQSLASSSKQRSMFALCLLYVCNTQQGTLTGSW